MIGLLRPYRGRMALMFVGAAGRDRRRPRAALPRRPRDRRRDRDRRPQRPRPDRRRLRRRRRRSTPLATYAETYLVGWVGTRALQDLRERIFAHIQSMSIGFFTRRSPGVLISRMTNDVEALNQLVTERRGDDVLQHPDPGRRGRDPARARRQAGADHLPHLPAAGDRQRRSSGSSPPAPTGRPGSGSRRSPPTCRRRSAASGSCAASARSRATSTR